MWCATRHRQMHFLQSTQQDATCSYWSERTQSLTTTCWVDRLRCPYKVKSPLQNLSARKKFCCRPEGRSLVQQQFRKEKEPTGAKTPIENVVDRSITMCSSQEEH